MSNKNLKRLEEIGMGEEFDSWKKEVLNRPKFFVGRKVRIIGVPNFPVGYSIGSEGVIVSTNEARGIDIEKEMYIRENRIPIRFYKLPTSTLRENSPYPTWWIEKKYVEEI